MPTNELILVDGLIESIQAERASRLADDVAFETFAAAMVLRDHNLSDEDIEVGRVAGGMDGGIDGVYVFLDEELLDEDSEIFSDDFSPKKLRKGVVLRLEIIQAKQETSFSETAIDKIASSLGRLLDLGQSDTELEVLYSQALISRLRLFTRAWVLLGARSPAIRLNIQYVTRGESRSAGPPVLKKGEDLKTLVERMVAGSFASVKFVGAQELWQFANTEPDYDLQLRFVEYFSKGESYTGLVNLSDYFEFLSNVDGSLRGHLFDWNVRDFQGAVNVNRDMQSTLESEDSDDFWWLNNGVTILCSGVSILGDKTFTMENVQIVNGMQTSYNIHSAITQIGAESERSRNRSVLVRVFKTEDAALRDRIIRATNSQTKVPDASLHATEEVHRKLEAFFSTKGWYYDRRKNYYKNKGKPADRIVSIGGLGQAVMAIGLSRPDDARARPSTLLNSPSDYQSVFDEKVPLGTYLWIAQTQRSVDLALLEPGLADAYLRTNFRFYVSLYLVTRAHGNRIYNPKQLSKLTEVPVLFTRENVAAALKSIFNLADDTGLDHDWRLDRVAKSREFAEQVIERAITDADAQVEKVAFDAGSAAHHS